MQIYKCHTHKTVIKKKAKNKSKAKQKKTKNVDIIM